jgi:addiction module RelE/StbE family toxin
MVKIEWSESAKKDLKNILHCISQDSPSYAEFFLNGILEKIDYLEEFPQTGRKVPESDDPNDRELIFQNYRIIYILSNEKVIIEMILHGSGLLNLKK